MYPPVAVSLFRSSKSSISIFIGFKAGVKARCGIKQLKGPSALFKGADLSQHQQSPQ